MELLDQQQEAENLRTLTRDYILSQIIGKVGQVKWGFKVLIVDPMAMRVLDAAVEMKQITEAGVSDVVMIANERLPLPKLDGIYFLSPTDENVQRIMADFDNPDEPMYRAAHLFFTAKMSEANMKLLAGSRAISRIKTLREAHVQYLVYDSHTFHFDTPKSFFNLYSRQGLQQPEFAEIAEKLATVMSTLGEYPVVRYSKANGSGAAIASHVFDRLEKFRRAGLLKGSGERSVLLILDRTNDLVSPLVHELTYQAMIEDLIGPKNDVFTYTFTDQDNKAQSREVILNENDVIYKAVRHLHIQHGKSWIANEFKKFREQSKDMHGGHDITKTLRAMPKYQTLKAKFAVHLNLAKDCMDTFNRTSIDRLCAIEQDLATGLDEYHNKTSNIPTRLVPLLNDGMISKENKIRLLMLFYLTEEKATDGRSRFESSARLTADEERLLTNWIGMKDLTTRTDQRRKPLGDNEWEFVVSRYQPAIRDIVTDLCQSKLQSALYPFLNKDEESQGSAKGATNLSKRAQPASSWGAKPGATPAASSTGGSVSSASVSSANVKYEGSRIFIFVSGGVTYSELREVHRLSALFKRDIIIGSTHILKPNEFIAQVGALSQSANDKAYVPNVITKPK